MAARKQFPPRASPRCSSRCSATSSGGRTAAAALGQRATASPARSSSSSTTRATGCRSSGSGRSASSTALDRRQALRRARRRAAGRGDAAGHRARRRARVGVPVPVRRPGAAVGQLARPGHRAAGDGALGHAAQPPGRRVPDRRARARGSSRPSRRGRAVADGGGAHYLQYSGLPKLQMLNGFIQSLVGLYDFAALTGDATARSLFDAGDLAARAGGPDVRHRRLVAVLARVGQARVRPRLPHAAARFPRPALHAHAAIRVLQREPAFHELPQGAAGRRGARRARCGRRGPASCASSSRRSRA